MSTVSIPLSQGKSALIDEDDLPLVSPFRWYAHRIRHRWYAATYRDQKIIHMHRLITNAPAGTEVDHKDGDGLNNMRENLRGATRAQNAHNAGLRPDNKSSYKGVSWDTRRKRWVAQIGIQGKRVFLGYHHSAEAAARAYDEAARQYHGEFAFLNLP